jgi:CubicO group peptidase (beta-lactamase class C family)
MNFKILLYYTLLFVFISGNVVSQNQIDLIDSIVTTYNKNEIFNGVVLISRQGQIIYNKAFGPADREWKVPATIDTKYKIGSISKPITAILILQLVEEGLISLDGVISDYLPECKIELSDSITIHHLLTHTSGILYSLPPEEEARVERLQHSLNDLLKYPETAKLSFKPGSKIQYSNFAYSILALITEKVTNKAYADLLKEKIFETAGMQNTRQQVNTEIVEKLAKGYEYNLLSGYENATYLDASYVTGYGGIITTAYDLFLLDKALYSNRLLSDSMKIKMHSITQQGNYGYGWFIKKRNIKDTKDTLQIADHTGSVNGFNAYMTRVLSDSTLIVVLKNERADTYETLMTAYKLGEQIISVLNNENIVVPKKSIRKEIGILIKPCGVDSAISKYKYLKSYYPDEYNFDESQLKLLGLELLLKYKMPDAAIQIFELNMFQFPKSYDVYDSYAYALMQKEKYIESINYYKKGFEVLKKYPELNNNDSVKKCVENALKNIKKMEEKL